MSCDCSSDRRLRVLDSCSVSSTTVECVDATDALTDSSTAPTLVRGSTGAAPSGSAALGLRGRASRLVASSFERIDRGVDTGC